MPVPLILGSPGGAIAAGSGLAKFGTAALGALKFAGKHLLGPLSNLFGKNKRRDKRSDIQRTVDEARAAGIHPLFALGSAANISPTWTTGSTAGDGLRAGAEIFRSVSAEREAKDAAGLTDEIARAQIRSLNASASRDETAAQLALSDHALNQQAMAAQNRDRINTRLDAVLAGAPDIFGAPPFKPVAQGLRPVLVNGKTIMIPDQDLVETGEMLGAGMTATGLWQTLKDAAKTAGKRFIMGIKPPPPKKRSKPARKRKPRRMFGNI